MYPVVRVRHLGLRMVIIDFNKLRFLVCDDNAHMRRILRTRRYREYQEMLDRWL